MTTWRDAPLNDAVFCQALYRDDGKPLGVIMRYYEDATVPPDVRLRNLVAVFKEGVTRPPGTCRGRPPFSPARGKQTEITGLPAFLCHRGR
jgi:hypothetical protein